MQQGVEEAPIRKGARNYVGGARKRGKQITWTEEKIGKIM